ncbi:MAG: alpha/beta hydrolase [Ilumatobacteraceae bacterium]
MTAYERRILAGLDATPDPDTDDGLAFPAEAAYEIDAAGFAKIHVEECGTGQPVLLIHGHGSNLAIFAALATRLASHGCRVVAMDHRGFGRSSAVPVEFEFEGLIDDVAMVLERLDLRGAVVVGHSMGGAVALGLGARGDEVADRVSALVLLNGTSRGPPDRPLWRARVAVLEWAVTERIGRHPRHGIALTRGNFGRDARRSHVVSVRHVGFASPSARRRGFTRRLLGVDLSQRLSEIRVPVVVIAGENDRTVSAPESSLLPITRRSRPLAPIRPDRRATPIRS